MVNTDACVATTDLSTYIPYRQPVLAWVPATIISTLLQIYCWVCRSNNHENLQYSVKLWYDKTSRFTFWSPHVHNYQARRDGGKGEFSRARDVWGSRHRSKIPNLRCFRWLLTDVKYPWIHLSDHGGEAYDAPQIHSRMVRGYLSPCFLLLDAFGVSISAHAEWGCEGPAKMVSRAPLWLSTGLHITPSPSRPTP